VAMIPIGFSIFPPNGTMRLLAIIRGSCSDSTCAGGNNQSRFYATGNYGPITKVFRKTRCHRFLLEFDDERWRIQPWREVPEDRTVALGLVSSKKRTLESKDELKQRIQQASAFSPLERLASNPQCGFASTIEGNLLTSADQEAKLRVVAETAQKVRGTTAAPHKRS
jgi:5-methyltetrahydropteroyltriglutamate--homocysteine methyltransferase